jgi:nitrate reductase / nitrite oxidoreductase, alpha subunit
VTSTRRPEAGTTGHAAGFDSELSEALVRTSRFFRRGEVSADLRSLHQIGGRDADSFYRDRWSHDKVVRSTHGVNCTGSCSWKVYVKDGIITWEAQQTDYPSTGPDRPEYEPGGCPRGAAFTRRSVASLPRCGAGDDRPAVVRGCRYPATTAARA